MLADVRGYCRRTVVVKFSSVAEQQAARLVFLVHYAYPPARALTFEVKSRVSIFVAALFIRGIVLHHFYPLLSSERYSAEPVTIAKSLLFSHTFGGVYGRPEATAWLAPGYPVLVAVVFWIFGIATPIATKVLLLMNGLFSALTAVVTYQLGKTLVSNAAGLIAGWAWALSGYVAAVSFLIWDTSASTLLLSLAVLLTLTYQRSRNLLTWIWLGALWTIAALFSPAVLAPFAALVLYLAWRGRRWLALIAPVACALLLVPWSVRNWKDFHQVFLVRDNMWSEIYFGNADYSLHPMGNSGEYQRLGEGRFVAMLKGKAFNWIGSHPMQFARNSLARAAKFWTLPRFTDGTLPVCLCMLGLAIALYRGRASALPLLLVLAAYPLVYYMSVVFSRFRYLIDPIVYVWGGYGLQVVAERVKMVIPWRAEQQSFATREPGSESV